MEKLCTVSYIAERGRDSFHWTISRSGWNERDTSKREKYNGIRWIVLERGNVWKDIENGDETRISSINYHP